MDKFVYVTKQDIVEGLHRSGLKSGDHLIAHGSLKSFGFVVGGAETVVQAILEVIGKEGTLMAPAQTWKNLDPETGVHWDVPKSQWQMIRDEWPAFDKAVTPSIGMGKIAESIRIWPESKRSNHPARSFAAVGAKAEYLTENHDLSNIFGQDSPLHRLYLIGGKILLLGVFHDKNTSIHLAETRAEFTGKRFTTESSAVEVDGERRWISYETQDVDDCDFVQLGESYEKDRKVAPVVIGNAEVRCIDQVDFVDYAVSWLEENRK